MLNEFLTNGVWLKPQIDFLVYLQSIREATGGIFDNFLLSLTSFGETIVPVTVMCIIYWCFDFKTGVYLFSLNPITMMTSQLFKTSACVYRPWILDNSIQPQATALTRAGGYSFPSGHSAMATSSFGGMAFAYRKNKLLCPLLIFLVLLIGFSRLYLGVHTPQDVIVGIGTGLIFIFATNKIIKWCENDKNRYLYFLAIIDFLVILLFIYTCTKNYPMDYVDGILLSNPLKVKYITVMYGGQSLGLINGALLCARFFPFNPTSVSKKMRIIRGLIGLILIYFLLNVSGEHFWKNISDFKIAFSATFLATFTLTGIYPFIFTRFEKNN